MPARRRLILALASSIAIVGCTPPPSADIDRPSTTSEVVVPDGAVLFREPQRVTNEEGIVGYVSPGERVAAGHEIEVGILTDRCAVPVLTIYKSGRPARTSYLEWWMQRWWEEEAENGTLLTVAVPEDFSPGNYTLRLVCSDRQIDDSIKLEFVVDSVAENPVRATDTNTPNVFCPDASLLGDCPIQDRRPPDGTFD